MTHTEILLFVLWLFGGLAISILAYMLNEAINDINELKALLEEH